MGIPNSQMSLVSRAKPQPKPDTIEAEDRVTPYGDKQLVVVSSTTHVLADEGSYVCATNPTPGTLIAYGSGGTQATFVDTAGFMVWKNNAPLGGPRLSLHRLRLLIGGTVPAAATSTQIVVATDTGSRLPTANFDGPGTGATAPSLFNANQAYASVYGQLWIPKAGVMTIPANTNRRILSRASLRQAISVTLDEYVIQFGSMDGFNSFGASGGVGRYTTDVAPVVLNPQDWCVLHLWQPSATTNPLSFEFEATWWER